MLIIFSGLPATGKTTIAKALAKDYHATYLRIDTLEHRLKVAYKQQDVADVGYQLGYALAAENLTLGNNVIADSVNPINLSRVAWRNVALQANSPYLEVEIVCSDQSIHQYRAQTRTSDINDFILPSWQAITSHDYEPWVTNHLILDTATLSVQQAVSLIKEQLSAY